MISNRVKRNIWLTLVILSGVAIIDRAIRVAMCELEWWQLVSTVIIACFCIKFYLCYKKKAETGNF